MDIFILFTENFCPNKDNVNVQYVQLSMFSVDVEA